MEERHRLQLIQNLVDRFEYLGEAQFNLNGEMESLEHPITRTPVEQSIREDLERRFLERIQYRRAHDTATLVPVAMVVDPRGHEEWYEQWYSQNNNDISSYYWKRLENFLSHELTRKHGPDNAGRIIRSIDDATFRITEKLSSPTRREFNYKGLVLGYVQSGKTANFTALIAKAVDAGYKFIIVLAGIHNILRKQTQVRLDRELTGQREIDGPENYIDLPGPGKGWNRLTTAHNDFSTTNIGFFENFCRMATPTLAVVKKNVTVLNRLIEYIAHAPEALRNSMPVLIIDDEADQASIDGNATVPGSDPTATNECIRRLLTYFTRKVYVGYTATPFANVLINMDTNDDLYPRNFIVSLPEPEGYFGTSRIFQGTLAENFVIEIPDEANLLIRHGLMTDNLSNAIDHFIISCAIRNLRGDRLKPMSMLVHVSHRIASMATISNIIIQYIQDIGGRYTNQVYRDQLRNEFQETWRIFRDNAEQINTALQKENLIPEFDQIWSEVANVLDILSIVELNSDSDDTLDYTTGEEIKVIAVGGNQLSRGLTLEGLMTSYYLRASRQYDTLLQMGRWFGYRMRYEDLTRVYTTEQIWDFFEHLALVEQELRAEIYRYEEEGTTPAEFAVAIRAHRTLMVTAPNKMGAARPRQTSYSRSLNQTIYMPLNRPDSLRSNYDLGNEFLRRFNANDFTLEHGVHLLNNRVDGDTILNEFLNHYIFVDRENIRGRPSLDAESLLSYISRRIDDDELTEWSLALIGNTNPNFEGDPIEYGGLRINRIARSRKHDSEGVYNIGVLTEADHLKIDLAETAITPYDGRSAQNPLLLLYLIGRDSRAQVQRDNPQPGERIDFYRFVQSERIDVLGIAIVLPQSPNEHNNYIGQ